MEIREAIEGFKMDNEMLSGTGNDAVIERNNLAIKALEKDEHKCDECAGCTTWKCDCANIRDKAIDDFIEEAMKQFTNFDLNHGYPTVTDCKTILRDVAKQLKHE